MSQFKFNLIPHKTSWFHFFAIFIFDNRMHCLKKDNFGVYNTVLVCMPEKITTESVLIVNTY